MKNYEKQQSLKLSVKVNFIVYFFKIKKDLEFNFVLALFAMIKNRLLLTCTVQTLRNNNSQRSRHN